MTGKLDQVVADGDDFIAADDHKTWRLRLNIDFGDFVKAPTDTNLRALAKSALNYQASVLLGRGREP